MNCFLCHAKIETYCNLSETPNCLLWLKGAEIQQLHVWICLRIFAGSSKPAYHFLKFRNTVELESLGPFSLKNANLDLLFISNQ